MLNKLQELRDKSEQLKFNDFKRLENIKRKGRIYLKLAFTDSHENLDELNKIHFISMFKGNERLVWEEGKTKLVSFFNSKIEELELLESNKNIETQEIINNLKSTLKNCQDKKAPWIIFNWQAILPITLIIIGAAFTLGFYFGNYKFDKSKNELIEEIAVIKDSIRNLNDLLHTTKSESTTTKKLKNQ